MKIHRFITPFEIKNNSIIIEDMELLHQWRDVLKLRKDETIILTDETQIEAVCVIESLSKNEAILHVTEIRENNNPPLRNITLYLAILKKENFELVAQKASEMGIYTIVPIVTERTIKTGLNMDRLLKISREAAELSGRSTFTAVEEAMLFKDAITKDIHETKILFDISGERFVAPDIEQASIYIGPEGGFTEEEIIFAKANGCNVANLGNLTLRGETAAIIAGYLSLK